MPALPDAIQQKLHDFTPTAGTSVRNPVDTSVGWGPDGLKPMLDTIRIVAEASNVDYVLYHTGWGWGPSRGGGPDLLEMARNTANALGELAAEARKPVVCVSRTPTSEQGMGATLAFMETAASHGRRRSAASHRRHLRCADSSTGGPRAKSSCPPSRRQRYTDNMYETTLEEFEEMVRRGVEALPAEFRERIANVEFAVEETARAGDYAFAVPRNATLLGVYRGVPLTRRGSHYNMATPDTIVIFRQPLQRMAGDASDLATRVYHVVRHEVAHYFGISDERLREIGAY
jgi:predicted Zn-dependent protease with MMP-like domain